MKDLFARFRQYTRVYRVLMRLNFNKLIIYRADLISSALAHTIWAAFTIIQMVLLTSKTSHVYGWSRNELLVLAAIYNIIFCFFYLLFSRGFGAFSATINYGRLDSILMKPIDSQFLATCLFITYTHGIRFVIGFGFLVYMMTVMHLMITPVAVITAVLLVIFSLMIIYSFWMLVMTLVIWFPKLSNLTDLLYQVNQVTKFPQEIYKGVSIYLFFVLFPLTVIVVAPSKALLNKMSPEDFFLPMLVALVLFVLARRFWQFALRFYTSASG
jgi:ABC-2 type transport system permease protein